MELIAIFRKRHPEVLAHVAPTVEGFVGHAGRRLMSPLTRSKLERILSCLLDEKEFLGPFGIRSLSRHHLENPFVFHTGGQEHRVQYLPAESNTGMFGGNSNWRGPVWMPVNALIVRGLLNLYGFYGNDLKVECPTGSGNRMTFEVAGISSASQHLSVTRAAAGFTATPRSQADRTGATWFSSEFFHGDNGPASGEPGPGWTGLIAVLLDLCA
jgi:hypothetical protein